MGLRIAVEGGGAEDRSSRLVERKRDLPLPKGSIISGINHLGISLPGPSPIPHLNMESLRICPVLSRQSVCWLTEEVRPVLSSWLCLNT